LTRIKILPLFGLIVWRDLIQVLRMTAPATSKVARALLGLAVVAALLVAGSHQLAAKPVTERAGVWVICTLASDHGAMTDDADCGIAGVGHSHCLPHGGCSAFTLPAVLALAELPRSASWLRRPAQGLLGRIIPLETPPPIVAI
jgi:hypothetical protein